ncbi:hypothetical protein QTN47_02895 [Danxiaibacter flavus]|uniref:Lipopolysaccharide export system protein LptC n=1 Tax=Danxiaibacter flavus TaxID=3049108 RepID=A0ABV3Z975_9BACT|nr:hypothetical protein QNM32_02890 [Chitinophagaceae bacterium DXS]
MSKKKIKQLRKIAETRKAVSLSRLSVRVDKSSRHPARNILFKLLLPVLVIMILIISIPYLRDYFFKSKRQMAFEQYHRIGLTIPKEVQVNQGVIQLKLGKGDGESLPVSKLKEGFYVNGKISSACSNDPYKIYLKLEDQKVFISAQIKSFDGKLIGEIRNNKWVLKDEQILDYHGDGSTYFEVMDKNKRIPLSITSNGTEILLSGFFIDKDCFVVLGEDALVTKDLNEAQIKAAAITPYMVFDSVVEN